MSIDEHETGLRRILNFGHTVGHALEAMTGVSALPARRSGRLGNAGGGRDRAGARRAVAGAAPAPGGARGSRRARARRSPICRSPSCVDATTRDKKVVAGTLHFVAAGRDRPDAIVTDVTTARAGARRSGRSGCGHDAVGRGSSASAAARASPAQLGGLHRVAIGRRAALPRSCGAPLTDDAPRGFVERARRDRSGPRDRHRRASDPAASGRVGRPRWRGSMSRRRRGSRRARDSSRARARCPASGILRARSSAAALSSGTGLFSSAAVALQHECARSAARRSARSRSGGIDDGKDVEPEEEILAKLPGGDRRAQVAVGRGDDAHVDLNRGAAAEPLEACAPASARSSLGCSASGSSPISSRKSVPRCATSKRAGLARDRRR